MLGLLPGEKPTQGKHTAASPVSASAQPSTGLAQPNSGGKDGDGKFRTGQLSPPGTLGTKERENTVVSFLKIDLLKAK